MEGRDIPAFFILYISVFRNFIFGRRVVGSDFPPAQSKKLDLIV